MYCIQVGMEIALIMQILSFKSGMRCYLEK